MPRPVRLSEDAIVEARAAFQWYRQRSDRAAARFRDELDQAVEAIRTSPEPPRLESLRAPPGTPRKRGSGEVSSVAYHASRGWSPHFAWLVEYPFVYVDNSDERERKNNIEVSPKQQIRRENNLQHVHRPDERHLHDSVHSFHETAQDPQGHEDLEQTD